MKRDNLKLEIDSEEEVDNPDDKEDRYSKHKIKYLLKNYSESALNELKIFCPVFLLS